MSGDAIQHFITRWSAASASERANSQLFLSELCDLLNVPRPEPTFTGGYAFEFPVPQQQRDGSVTEGRIDLYKRGCFVLESKQFHAAHPEATPLQLAAEEAGGVAAVKKKSRPTRGTTRHCCASGLRINRRHAAPERASGIHHMVPESHHRRRKGAGVNSPQPQGTT